MLAEAVPVIIEPRRHENHEGHEKRGYLEFSESACFFDSKNKVIKASHLYIEL